MTAGRWYLLQTNYDPWTKPPFYDDRRTPGNICMKEWGQENAGTLHSKGILWHACEKFLTKVLVLESTLIGV